MLVMCSTFVSLNGNALAGPRAYFAMARDGLFPGGFAACTGNSKLPPMPCFPKGSGRPS